MLARFEIDVKILKEYPHVLESMFTILNESIPMELIPNIASNEQRYKSNRRSMGQEEDNRQELGLEELVGED